MIELDDEHVEALDRLATKAKLPRADLIREAIVRYLVRHSRPGITAGFGAWGDHAVDGIEYQERIRAE